MNVALEQVYIRSLPLTVVVNVMAEFATLAMKPVAVDIEIVFGLKIMYWNCPSYGRGNENGSVGVPSGTINMVCKMSTPARLLSTMTSRSIISSTAPAEKGPSKLF